MYPGGSRREFEYDPLMRLHRLLAKDPGGTALLDYTYEYDAVGNIVTKATEHGNYAYGYDSSSRLTSADNPALPDETYTYDHVGNRQTASGVSGTWSYNINNELLGYADVEYTYDANGNLTQKRVGAAAVNYSYNAENRLIKVEDDLTKVVMAEYGYDPFGRRLWKDVQGVRTYFFYSEEGLIAEYDATGNELRSYGYQPDSTWGTDPLWLKENGQYYFYQNDHLGTPQKLVAQNGAVVWSATYEAFGQAHIEMETVVNNLRLPGQYFDAETGLYYNWYRYYEPMSGRYMQIDLVSQPEGNNRFVYALNNPESNMDPFGLWVHPHQIVPPAEALRIVGNVSTEFEARYHTASPRKLQELAKQLGYDGSFRRIAPILMDPKHRNGILLGILARKNRPGGAGPGKHNRFVFTCRDGWIDMGHFFNAATVNYWRYATGLSFPQFDTLINYILMIAGEYEQEYEVYFTGVPNQSAFTPEDLISNQRGLEFGETLATSGTQSNVYLRWFDFLQASGAVHYQRKDDLHEDLKKDVLKWWVSYKTPDSEDDEDEAPLFNEDYKHPWEVVKWDSTQYCAVCCCAKERLECRNKIVRGMCQPKPFNPHRWFPPISIDGDEG